MKDGKPVHPIDPKYLKAVVDDYKKQGKQFKMGMVFPVSTHINYELRYWLAAGGMNPGYYAPAKGFHRCQLWSRVLISWLHGTEHRRITQFLARQLCIKIISGAQGCEYLAQYAYPALARRAPSSIARRIRCAVSR